MKQKNKRHNNRLLTSIVASMVAFTALSQQQLVLGIVVDQLRTDYIELLKGRFGAGGFNRLIVDGAYLENVDFKCANLDVASGTALLMTGAYPNVNGISQQMVWNSAKRLPESVLTDAKSMGNYTNETYSPLALKVSTIADELRINNGGLGHVHAIAPDAQQAILLGGHAANSAFWINDANGKWCTTTFYKDVPQCISNRNQSRPLSVRMDTMSWEPSLRLEQYPDVPEVKKYYKFRYTFPQKATDRYRSYKRSALVNEEVTSVAIDYIKSLKLGNRGQLDMLNIGYTAAPYEYAKDSDYRIELQDTYVRLDRQLARLLDAVDSTVGLKNVVVVLSSTGYFNEGRPADPQFNIPTGEFHPERATSLLNMYLMAKYGNGQWVSGYYNEQIYLNRDLAKTRNVDLAELRKQSSEFLRQMSGVSAAYTFEEILNNPVNEHLVALHRTMIPDYQGDVTVEICPGWSIHQQLPNGKTQVKHIRTNAVSVPAFIMAPQVKAQRISSCIDAALLAPTVAQILHIRSPNAASSQPLTLH